MFPGTILLLFVMRKNPDLFIKVMMLPSLARLNTGAVQVSVWTGCTVPFGIEPCP